PRKIIQDILPTKHRSIREESFDNDSVSAKKNTRSKSGLKSNLAKDRDAEEKVPIHIERKIDKRSVSDASHEIGSRNIRNTAKPSKSRKNKFAKKWYLIGGGILIVCLIIIYMVSTSLARATITVTPRFETIPINTQITATRQAISPNLSFQTISTSSSATINVDSISGPIVGTYAKGTAILFNASSTAKTIIVGTRLQDSRGLIYKTTSTVVIPAAKTTNNKTAAGSMSVKIIADAPGPAFNLSLANAKTDLSIVAWQGTDKANIYYGKIASNITGGSIQTQSIVSSSTLAAATKNLSDQLSAATTSLMHGLIPNGYLTYPQSVQITFSKPIVAVVSTSTASITVTETMSAVLFNVHDLENTIAKSAIAQFPANNYVVYGLPTLSFAATSPLPFSPTVSNLTFKISGNLIIVGVVDTASLKKSVAGISLSDGNNAFRQFASVISNARIAIVPFWIHHVPSNLDKISIFVASSTVGH
ncbi:MAG: hypothetical protein KGJ35_02870, partial [Patescibacteria group bacterium]|nr:hypothetical protein [Patescibacteria group bacterium]